MSRILPFLPLPARDPDDPHRAATQLELFFDLISVIAIAAIAAGLHHAISEGHGLERLPAFVIMFLAIWWAWMNFTWFASAFDNDGPFYRILVMVIMSGEVIFAAGAEHMLETLDLGWGVFGWSIMRVGMIGLWLRASANEKFRGTCLRFAVGILLAQAYWVGFYFLAPPEPEYFFPLIALGFLIEFIVPVIAERAGATPFHRHHIIERYGLLMIISLGEIMLAISLGFGMLYGDHPTLLASIPAISGLVIVFALFWVYFCEAEHLPSRKLSTAFVWGYGHVLLFAAVTVLGSGIAAELDLISDHSHTTQAVIAWWLGAPLALFYIAMWLTRDRFFSLGARGFALPAMAAVSLGAAALAAPSWAFAIITVAAVLWRVPLHEPASATNRTPDTSPRPHPQRTSVTRHPHPEDARRAWTRRMETSAPPEATPRPRQRTSQLTSPVEIQPQPRLRPACLHQRAAA